MIRWSYVEVSVMTLLTAIRASVSGAAPWNSAGYSIAPTPMIAPWPFISRGTEWTVPMVPGLVRLIVVPAKSSTVSLLPGPADQVLVGRPELGEVERLGCLDVGHQQRCRVPSCFCMSMARPRLTCSGLTSTGLPSTSVVGVVHLRHRAQRLDQRVADQVGERHLAAAQRARWLLMTIRLSTSSFAGTAPPPGASAPRDWTPCW